MAINPDPSLLVCPAIFQNVIVDKEGKPLANGVLTFYQDSNRVLLKNIYQQTGSYPNYTYIAAPNPMTLSAAGTTVDQNGNDILVFFYPWSETNSSTFQSYFVTAYNEAGTLQFTREDFPFDSGEGGLPNAPNFVTQENYIINNRFWRNVVTVSPSSSNYTGQWTTEFNTTSPQLTWDHWTLCPDQHDGFSMPDFNYIVPNANAGSATETITFNTFTATSGETTLDNDIQPEYYITHTCTADAGIYTKIYQFPISLHLATLANQPFAFSIQGKGSIEITVSIYTYTGDGNASTATTIGTVQLTSSWTKWPLSGIFPPNFGLPSSTTGDDAYYLQISFSSGAAVFSFALPSLYLYDNASTSVNPVELFSFSTYDQIDTVICSPRTGDVRTSLNPFYPYGWLPMNGGTIGNSSSNATAKYNQYSVSSNIEMWPLYNLIWNAFSPYTLNGNPLIPIYTSAGSASTFGTSALDDWNANKTIGLTQMMGQVIMGTVPVSALTSTYKTTFTASSGSGSKLLLTAANATGIYNGMPFVVSNSGGALPGNLSANTIYYVAALTSSSTFYVATTFANAMAASGAFSTSGSSSTLISYSSAGTGTQTMTSSIAGTYGGEYAHTQLIPELATHSHPNSVNTAGVSSTTSTGSIGTGNTGNAGSSIPFNVVQPSTFYNIFIKL